MRTRQDRRSRRAQWASLDPNLRARVRHDVVGILRATETPAVFVTHDQGEALAAGDRVAVMQRGRIAQLDTPEAVFHASANRFVAAFMGEADFLSARETRAEFGADALDADARDDALTMLRPDDVTFRSDPGGTATVIDAEFRGSSWCYMLQLSSGTRVRSMRSHIAPVAIGSAVDVTLTDGHRPVVIPDG